MLQIYNKALIRASERLWIRYNKKCIEQDRKREKFFKGNQWTEEQLKQARKQPIKQIEPTLRKSWDKRIEEERENALKKEKQMIKIVLNYDTETNDITDNRGLHLFWWKDLEDHELEEPKLALESMDKLKEELDNSGVKPLNWNPELTKGENIGLSKATPAMEGEKPLTPEQVNEKLAEIRKKYNPEVGIDGRINPLSEHKVDLETLKLLFSFDMVPEDIIKLRDSGVI